MTVLSDRTHTSDAQNLDEHHASQHRARMLADSEQHAERPDPARAQAAARLGDRDSLRAAARQASHAGSATQPARGRFVSTRGSRRRRRRRATHTPQPGGRGGLDSDIEARDVGEGAAEAGLGVLVDVVPTAEEEETKEGGGRTPGQPAGPAALAPAGAAGPPMPQTRRQPGIYRPAGSFPPASRIHPPPTPPRHRFFSFPPAGQT